MNMKTFNFEITEILQKTIQINADNASEAYRIIKDMYDNEEVVLYTEDYLETEISLLE